MVTNYLGRVIRRGLSPLGVAFVTEGEAVALRKRVGELETALQEKDGAAGQPTPQALRRRLFRQLAAKGFRPTHILDVGAYAAGWSRDAHAIFPECAFTLIEPQIEMKPDLDQFCADVPKARWILAGAGAACGSMTLTIARNPDSSSFLFTEEVASKQGLQRRRLPMVTLDSVVAESSVPEIVKIDAEGMETEILRGAQNLLGVAELFFLELPLFDFWPGQTFHSVLAQMRDCGYEPYDFTDLIRRPSDNVLALIEVAFARKTGPLRDHRWG